MREIEFRAWDSFNGVYYYSDKYANLAAFFKTVQECIDGGNNITLQQFTGFRDKNNVEIFEGDVVQCLSHKEIPLTVDYCDGAYEMTLKDGGYAGRLCSYFPKQIEVIGNIYENKDLLK